MVGVAGFEPATLWSQTKKNALIINGLGQIEQQKTPLQNIEL